MTSNSREKHLVKVFRDLTGRFDKHVSKYPLISSVFRQFSDNWAIMMVIIFLMIAMAATLAIIERAL